MNLEKKLSVLDIAKELNAGKATIKFLLKRFKKWLPCDLIDGQAFYSAAIVKQLLLIHEDIGLGLLPSDIEKKLEALCDSDLDPDNLNSGDSDSCDLSGSFVNSSQTEDIRLSNSGLTLLRSLFSDIGEQQKRVAMAHEKRAEVEERKAVAIEKRAEAEEKKADAMNNIANALQEMNRLRTSDPDLMHITHQAVSIIAEDETDETNETGKTAETAETDTEDENREILDDLSSLIENDPPQLDDLSTLIDDLPEIVQPGKELDDLSKLIDDPEEVEDITEIKIDISPKEDLEKYKAAVMKIIIELKTDGLDMEEATNRLNRNRIKTLSGKAEWSQKAISQIYKFIESAE